MLMVGASNGKDYVFHLSSWLGAADQMRHGMMWPRWDFLAAYNAGEPRFVFYPPVSWMTGALLSFVLPVGALPFAMVWICLVIAGFSMYALAARYTSERGAMLAACFYIANPWMSFTVFARCAYGELFAAAFCPWLLAAALEEEPEALRIGLPLGLIWLSNIPGAILCTYLLAFVLAYRLVAEKRWTLVPKFALGLGFAIMMDALSFVPALVQRRYIDTDGAFPEGFRPIDNLAFFRTMPSDPFFLQAEHLGLILLVASLVLLAVRRSAVRPIMAVIAAGVGLSLTFLSRPMWAHLPELWIVQFPWRAIFILATVAALAAGIAFGRLPLGVALAVVLGLAGVETWAFHIPCTPGFTPRALAEQMLVERRNGVPTYEYFALSGDSGLLRPDNPPFWLAKAPGEYAAGTTPNLSEISEDGKMPVAPVGARLVATPMRFEVGAGGPGYLVINLQDYPNWVVRVNGVVARRVLRPDGLTVVEVPAGVLGVTVRWRHSWDEWVGLGLSLGALLVLGLKFRSERVRSGLAPQRQSPPV